ncbi:MAG: hypothetical protein DJ555_05890 [Desulfurococcaceae archaeon]|jgi:hypothetical protein|nr:MAG: hypothetical protein DJ555_05890 [Desulfurococcaceae archaeon]
MDVRRKRLRVLVDAWGEILSRNGKLSREDLVAILKEAYADKGVEPVRGAANPDDIYERDLIALYIVGVEGLGLGNEIPKEIMDLFSPERAYLEAADIALNSDPENARSKIIELFGKIPDSAILSKIFRVELLKYYYGFKKSDDMPRLIENLSKAFPEEEATFKRLSRFYIAIKVAEAIINGEVKNWVSKEAYKQAVAVKLGSPRAIPDDEYIAKIIATVFGLKPSKYSKILRSENQKQG